MYKTRAKSFILLSSFFLFNLQVAICMLQQRIGKICSLVNFSSFTYTQLLSIFRFIQPSSGLKTTISKINHHKKKKLTKLSTKTRNYGLAQYIHICMQKNVHFKCCLPSQLNMFTSIVPLVPVIIDRLTRGLIEKLPWNKDLENSLKSKYLLNLKSYKKSHTTRT